MDIEFCNHQCSIGVEARTKFLEESDSVYSAVNNFWVFTDKCFKTCPYKDKHAKEKIE